MPCNPEVCLNLRRRHLNPLKAFDPQPEPPALEAVLAELGHRWPMTGPLGILKEADLLIRFVGDPGVVGAPPASLLWRERGNGRRG
jgi:hypothetical protein